MASDKEIQQWLDKEIITQKQADALRQEQHQNRSSKLVTASATIGSLLIGLAAILFIAANWQLIPAFAKTSLLIVSTLAALYVGYYLTTNTSYPLVGQGILFLSAILYGATIILLTQIYNLQANSHIVVLLWIVGILPLIFIFNSKAIAILTTLLAYYWMGLIANSSNTFFIAFSTQAFILYILASFILFQLAALLYKKQVYADIARAIRLITLKASFLFLFFFTFNSFIQNSWSTTTISPVIVGLAIATTLILTFINFLFNQEKQLYLIEAPTVTLVTLVLALLYWFPSPTAIYALIFNLLLAALILLILYLGYTQEDIKLVNIGSFWLGALIFVRYIDWFWGLLPTSLFFLTGGVLLVVGGVALEKKRRQLKEVFA